MSQTKPEMLSRIKIEGFKSIATCDLELGPLNVLIGPNGAGKSNFLSFFNLMRAMAKEQLQLYVVKQGGPDAMLRFGRKRTPYIDAELRLDLQAGTFEYETKLSPNLENNLVISQEILQTPGSSDLEFGSGGKETELLYSNFELSEEERHTLASQYGDAPVEVSEIDAFIDQQFTPIEAVRFINRWQSYHFLDTGDDSPIKQLHGINDNLLLKPNGANLAAFLYMLKVKHKAEYQDIVETIELVAPFFDDFILRPNIHNHDVIELEWIEKGEETPLKAYMLSDGTLRFICLVTALLQPDEYLPKLILIDEPELGLHPYAITLLAALIKNASLRAQVILSTQSVNLLNEFEPDQVIVADRLESATVLKRLSEDDLAIWLEDYSLGELWEKNILGGRPSW